MEDHEYFVKDLLLKDINWEAIKKCLPCKKTKAHKEQRDAMFKTFDPNGNGYLSLAEIERGLLVLGKDYHFLASAKTPMRRAFMAAKAHSKSKEEDSVADDFVQKKEFRIFLLYLRQYFEYFFMFKKLDRESDNKLNVEEFKQAIP